MKIQDGQKFSHTLEQALFGTKSHLHAEMKIQWTVNLEKKTGGKQEGAEIGAGESRVERLGCLSQRGGGDFFPPRELRKSTGGSRYFAARGRI